MNNTSIETLKTCMYTNISRRGEERVEYGTHSPWLCENSQLHRQWTERWTDRDREREREERGKEEGEREIE